MTGQGWRLAIARNKLGRRPFRCLTSGRYHGSEKQTDLSQWLLVVNSLSFVVFEALLTTKSHFILVYFSMTK